jgi:hypothetical protein
MTTKKTTKKVVAKKKAVVAPIVPKNEDLFKVSIQMNDEVFESETENLRDCLLSFKFPTIKTKVLFDVEWHGKKVHKLLFVPQARRVFQSRMSAEFFAISIIKQLKAL